MEKLTLDLPAMYGDHHVAEVRRLLLELPGVADVYASSAFQVAEITYDPTKVTAETITATLDEAGYLGELLVPVEVGAGDGNGNGQGKPTFRHTDAAIQIGRSVTFTQATHGAGRPLWPCPGMGPIKTMEKE